MIEQASAVQGVMTGERRGVKHEGRSGNESIVDYTANTRDGVIEDRIWR